MTRAKKRKFRKKEINLMSMEVGIRKHMREHPLYGDEFKRQESINKLFESKKRLYKERMISR